MFFNIFKKYKKRKSRVEVIKIMISSLHIPEKQKDLYYSSLEVIWDDWLNNLYDSILEFSKSVEEENYKEIRQNNFSYISWMTKKEAEEKRKEINSFNFLINNL